MIKVYHDKVPSFGLGSPVFPDDYELVAYVETDSKDKAYELTNHIMQEWWKNPEVRCMKETRSTSVGDVMEVSGELWKVEPLGYKKLS